MKREGGISRSTEDFNGIETLLYVILMLDSDHDTFFKTHRMYTPRVNSKGNLGRMDTGICLVESLCCPPETVTTLLMDYNIKEKVKKQQSELSCELWTSDDNNVSISAYQISHVLH